VAALVRQFAGPVKLACHSRRITALILTSLPRLGLPWAPSLKSLSHLSFDRPIAALFPDHPRMQAVRAANRQLVRRRRQAVRLHALSASSSCRK
jgi:hypothetical protein